MVRSTQSRFEKPGSNQNSSVQLRSHTQLPLSVCLSDSWHYPNTMYLPSHLLKRVMRAHSGDQQGASDSGSVMGECSFLPVFLPTHPHLLLPLPELQEETGGQTGRGNVWWGGKWWARKLESGTSRAGLSLVKGGSVCHAGVRRHKEVFDLPSMQGSPWKYLCFLA